MRLPVRAVWFALACIVPALPALAAEEIYREETLEKDRLRYAERIQRLWERDLRPHLTQGELRALGEVRISLPLPAAGDHPLDFFGHARAELGPADAVVVLPVVPLKMVEDLAAAYAWLAVHDYPFGSLDDYTATFRRDPDGRRPAPLEALAIPRSEVSDLEVDEIAIELRNSAYAFLVLHQLGHRVANTQSDREEQADRFALEVLERSHTAPSGAMLIFQAQARGLQNGGPSVARLERLARELDAVAPERRLAAWLAGGNRLAQAEAEPCPLGLLLERRRHPETEGLHVVPARHPGRAGW